ncbi:hypothetical protein ACHAWF_016012 [Thalassiosira exigua]
MPPLSSSGGGSPQHIPQAWERQFSPPPVATAPVGAQQVIPHPQIPRSQTLLPSIANLNLDAAGHGIDAGSPPPVSPQLASAQSPVSASADDLKPLPQNLRGDPFRSAKVKTELCRFFNTPKGCVFGDKCNYAHGETDLKFNKLVDLESAGMIDIEVFRCHVCFTWVATGGCPFDQRCTRLHDLRVIGMQPTWLPHAEVLTNSAKKGKEVGISNLHHQQYSAVYSCSPIYGFAPKKRWTNDESSTTLAWKEFYSFCCSMDSNQPYSQGARWNLSPEKSASAKPEAEITEMHRLAMVLMMRERRKAQCYTYLPSHVFCGELCMVLQTSYFKLDVVESFQDIQRYQLTEISQEEAKSTRQGSRAITAREIAFGPVADASVRPVSIWFNINPEDIVKCTRQQARRHKRSRHRLRGKRKQEIKPEEVDIAASCPIPPFTCHQPMDDLAFNLVTGILSHRYRVLKYFSSSPDDRVLRSLASEEEKLRKSFESQRGFWMTWTWPKKIGSNDIKRDTEVPDVEGVYNFVTYGDLGYGEDSLFFGSDEGDEHAMHDSLQVISKQAKLATGFVWKSFVTNLQLICGQGAVDIPNEQDRMPTHDPILPRICRIPTLRNLSLGLPANRHSSRILPSIDPPLCSTSPVVVSLDDLIREWKLMKREFEENPSHPLKGVKQANPARRKALAYDEESAVRSWNREVPRL